MLDYLRKTEKVNQRYLWGNSSDYLIKGEENVFWGLLDDIYHWTNNKKSQYDPRSIILYNIKNIFIKKCMLINKNRYARELEKEN